MIKLNTMKKSYIIIFIFCIAFAACKKDSKPAPVDANTLHKVTFKVSSFSQQHLAFQPNSTTRPKSLNSLSTTYPSSSDTIRTYPALVYQVYDSTGKLVHQISQDTTTANFGTINDQLTAGTYTIIMVGGINVDTRSAGSEKLMPVNYGTTSTQHLVDAEVLYLMYNPYAGNSAPFFDETFYKKFTLTVTSGSIAQNISLPHIVGQLIVNIQDAIPANAQNIQLTIGSISYVYNLGTGLPDVKGDSGTMAYLVVPGVTNFKMYNYILNTTAPFSVTISAYSDGNVLIASKTIQNVSCAANQQVTLTGNLFGGTGNNISGDISATADTTWNSTTLNYHF